MLSEFFVYLRLGVEHILDLRGIDHILFVIALTLPYTVREWRAVVVQVTAFTVGHSLTLAAATLDAVRVSTPWIEFLIPVTIAATAAVQLRSALAVRPGRGSPASPPSSGTVDDPGEPGGHRPLGPGIPSTATWLLAFVFGLIHGLGFSNFLRAVLGGGSSIVWPLFAFNIGLEAGQLVVVALMLAVTTRLIGGRALSRTIYVGILSTAIGMTALYLSVIRLPL
ncbi:MAG: HupE/UreJ family protein [Gemmatimonadetes bacterium]|nr:HupE/UreJ family protein [Gemmatimonadota bacterium]